MGPKQSSCCCDDENCVIFEELFSGNELSEDHWQFDRDIFRIEHPAIFGQPANQLVCGNGVLICKETLPDGLGDVFIKLMMPEGGDKITIGHGRLVIEIEKNSLESDDAYDQYFRRLDPYSTIKMIVSGDVIWANSIRLIDGQYIDLNITYGIDYYSIDEDKYVIGVTYDGVESPYVRQINGNFEDIAIRTYPASAVRISAFKLTRHFDESHTSCPKYVSHGGGFEIPSDPLINQPADWETFRQPLWPFIEVIRGNWYRINNQLITEDSNAAIRFLIPNAQFRDAIDLQATAISTGLSKYRIWVGREETYLEADIGKYGSYVAGGFGGNQVIFVYEHACAELFDNGPVERHAECDDVGNLPLLVDGNAVTYRLKTNTNLSVNVEERYLYGEVSHTRIHPKFQSLVTVSDEPYCGLATGQVNGTVYFSVITMRATGYFPDVDKVTVPVLPNQLDRGANTPNNRQCQC